MSKTTKKKYVEQEVLYGYEDLIDSDEYEVVKVLGGKGNNLHEVKNEHGEVFLVSMPTKFRKTIWIKRDDYILVERVSEGDKVKAVIHTVLYKDSIKELKKRGKWPSAFEEEDRKTFVDMLPKSDDEGDVEFNPNRNYVLPAVSDSD